MRHPSGDEAKRGAGWPSSGRDGSSTPADEMHNFQDVAGLQPYDGVFGTRHHLTIPLHSDRSVSEPEVFHEPHHREPGGHVLNFSVDGQTHGFYVCVRYGGCQ